MVDGAEKKLRGKFMFVIVCIFTEKTHDMLRESTA